MKSRHVFANTVPLIKEAYKIFGAWSGSHYQKARFYPIGHALNLLFIFLFTLRKIVSLNASRKIVFFVVSVLALFRNRFIPVRVLFKFL